MPCIAADLDSTGLLTDKILTMKRNFPVLYHILSLPILHLGEKRFSGKDSFFGHDILVRLKVRKFATHSSNGWTATYSIHENLVEQGCLSGADETS